MNIERIVDLLCAVGNYSANEASKYISLVELNCYPFSQKEYDENDERLLEYYIATKTNYQIALCAGDSEVSSFKAGDVSVTASSKDSAVSNARHLFEQAINDASHLTEDTGFYFRGV